MKNVAIKGKYIPKNKDKFLSKRTPIYRSMWERRFMIYCDRSDNIIEWDSESIHIPYISPKDDRWHNYYPDFYVKYNDKNDQIIIALIEIKPVFKRDGMSILPNGKPVKNIVMKRIWNLKFSLKKNSSNENSKTQFI